MKMPPALVVFALFSVAILCDGASLVRAAPKSPSPVPDLTKGGEKDDKHDWNLGPTGARGWIWGRLLETTDARQILITKVDKGSPADGVLEVGDVILGVSDKLLTEDARKSFGRAITAPGQLYDYTPRSPGQFATPHGGGEASWWLLEIDRPFDHWSVLARFQGGEQIEQHQRELRGAPEEEIKFADLGLEADREYLVFEFWSQKFLGKAKGSFTAPMQDRNTGLHVFAIREAREYPWVLSTKRHISQGGVSLLDERWDTGGNVLSGKSAVVVGDPYVMTVYLPEGFRLESAEVGGEKVEIANQKETATVRIVPSATKTVAWEIAFAAEGA